MTRTHKYNERDHHHEVEADLPKWFAKSGHIDSAPNKVKKDGAGKSNWGRPADELNDQVINFTNPRRRSNSSADPRVTAGAFKSKFETIEPEPVFEEELHGASAPDYKSHFADEVDSSADDELYSPLEEASTNGSVSGGEERK